MEGLNINTFDAELFRNETKFCRLRRQIVDLDVTHVEFAR
jgi:hypothetical protein